ncbi:hypothetical protein IMZ68_03850 [Candidatus Bathyarchaeota archaeon]|nr:hypothetical protein [Candidatus Bathyarchaeota archaeon]
MNLRNLLAAIVGVLFILSAFVPLASYHFEGEASIIGVLWNFMLPTGWFTIAAGAVLLFHKRIGLKNKRLAYAMLAVSLFLLIISILQGLGLLLDVDYLLGLLHGVKGDFDLQGSMAVPLFLGIAGIFASLMLIATGHSER